MASSASGSRVGNSNPVHRSDIAEGVHDLRTDTLQLEMMKMQKQMLELQLKLNESNQETASLKSKIQQIQVASQVNIYQVQLNDLQQQEAGLDDKIFKTQDYLKNIYASGNNPGGVIGKTNHELGVLQQKRTEIATTRAAIYAKMKEME